MDRWKAGKHAVRKKGLLTFSNELYCFFLTLQIHPSFQYPSGCKLRKYKIIPKCLIFSRLNFQKFSEIRNDFSLSGVRHCFGKLFMGRGRYRKIHSKSLSLFWVCFTLKLTELKFSLERCFC